MNIARLIIVALCAALISCSAAAPARTQYLLRTEATARSVRVEAPVRVGLATITIAPYLRQSGIVVATEDGQVRVAKQHLWAEPLDAGLRSYLRAEISDQLGYDISSTNSDKPEWAYAVDVYVDRLHGTMAGTAVLDASYQISVRSGGGKLMDYRFSNSENLERKGYSGLVDAQRDLIRKLAAAIAKSLAELRDR
jgi:uncharacterized lipoprotein YmbA